MKALTSPRCHHEAVSPSEPSARGHHPLQGATTAGPPPLRPPHGAEEGPCSWWHRPHHLSPGGTPFPSFPRRRLLAGRLGAAPGGKKTNNEILEPHPPAGTCDTAQARGWHTPSPTLAPGAAPGPAAGTGALRVAQMGCGGGRVTAPSPSPRAGMSWQSIPHPRGTHTAPAPAGVGCPAGYPGGYPGGCPALHPSHTPLAAPCACPVFCPPPSPARKPHAHEASGRKEITRGIFYLSLSFARSHLRTPRTPGGFGSAALPGPPPQGLSEAPGTAEVPGGGGAPGVRQGMEPGPPCAPRERRGGGRAAGRVGQAGNRGGGGGGYPTACLSFPLLLLPQPLPTPGAPRGG